MGSMTFHAVELRRSSAAARSPPPPDLNIKRRMSVMSTAPPALAPAKPGAVTAPASGPPLNQHAQVCAVLTRHHARSASLGAHQRQTLLQLCSFMCCRG